LIGESVDCAMREFNAICADMRQVFRQESTISLLDLAVEFEELGTDLARAWACNARGTHAARTGQYDEAIRYLEESIALFSTVDATVRDTSSLRNNLGLIHLRRGNLEQALPLFREAYAEFIALGAIENAANACSNIGVVYYQRAEYPDAVEYFRRALSHSEEAGQRSGVKSAYGNLGSAYTEAGDYPTGLEYFHRVLDMFEQDGQATRTFDALTNIGIIHYRIGRYDEALEYQQRAYDALPEDADPYNTINVTRAFGEIYAAMASYAEAIPWFRQSYDVAVAIGARSEEAQSLVGLCSAMVHAGDVDAAFALVTTHEELLSSYPSSSIYRRVILARVSSLSGDHAAAMTLLREAFDRAQALSLKTAVVEIAKDLRDVARTMGDLELYIEFNDTFSRVNDELQGAAASRRLAMHEKDRAFAQERERVQKFLDVLHATLPPAIAERVARGERVHDELPDAAVLFSDIVGFTTHSTAMEPGEVVLALEKMYATFDEICDHYGVTKVKTIGDSYMCCRGDGTRVENAVAVGMVAHAMMSQSFKWPNGAPVLFRIGAHSGPVTAGVIGTQRLQYDVWGDTVNVASRMESHGKPGRIHVSEAFATALQPSLPASLTLHERGSMEVKGKGMMTTYWLTSA